MCMLTEPDLLSQSDHQHTAAEVAAGLCCTGTKTPDLATFAAVLQRLAHGARVPLRYFVFSDRHRARSGLLTIDRAWCACRVTAGASKVYMV